MKYDIVFEGGGAKGMVLVGAYDVFVQKRHTHGRLLGTSAGAITAALIAAGYTPQEMLDALTEREDGVPIFAKFMGDPPPFAQEEISKGAILDLLRAVDFTFIPDFIENKMDEQIAEALAQNQRSRHLVSLVERGGWFSAARFTTWLQEKLDTGTWSGGQRQFSGMTLEQFYDATKVDVSLVASDTSGYSLLVLNHRTAPKCPLVMAVRMSMSIPFVWREVEWQKAWGTYLGKDISGHAIVDGGILSNFPIELFISDDQHVTSVMGPKQDNPVLGMYIDEFMPVASTRGLLIKSEVELTKLQTVQRLFRLINTTMMAHDKMVMDEFAHMVVRLPAGGYGTTEFDMSDGRRDALVNAGRAAMRAYFARPAAAAAPMPGPGTPGVDQPSQRASRIAQGILRGN